MCQLLTVAFPSKIPAAAVPPSFQVNLFEGAGSGHQYCKTLVPYGVTAGGCSCDLVWPVSDPDRLQSRLSALRKKYLKNGWSRTKIERALAEMEAGELSKPSIRADVLAFFTQQFAMQRHMELIVHDHIGDFVSEPFDLRGEIRVQCPVILEIGQLQEDVKYEFRMQPHR